MEWVRKSEREGGRVQSLRERKKREGKDQTMSSEC